MRPDLVALDRGELGADEAARVREHVGDCTSCAAELRRLRAAVRMFARATEIEPAPAASARLRAALDRALAENAAQQSAQRDVVPVHDLSAARSRGLAGVWQRARERYDESASFRRFTLASVGLHAAAAVVLAVLLAQTGGPFRRPATFRVAMDDPAFSLPGGAPEIESRTAQLPAFEPADGFSAPGAPGAVFPNRRTAERWGASATEEGRRQALRVALGDDASRAETALRSGLSWLAAQRGADGAIGAAGEQVEVTAAAVTAFAADGRSTADDAGLGLSVAWLERVAAEEGGALESRALAVRALSAQFVTDFGRLSAEARARRAGAVAGAVARIEDEAARAAALAADASATVAVVGALADVRAAGIRDTGESLAALVRSLEWKRSADGRLSGNRSDDGGSLTAALVEVADDAGARPLADSARRSLRGRIDVLAATSTRDAARGAAALAALGEPVTGPLAAVVRAQRPDGRWTASARKGRTSDAFETAYGVVALTRAYRR